MKRLTLFLLLAIGLQASAFAGEAVTLQDGTGNELGTSGNPLKVTGAGAGSVTSVSVVSANGLAGSIATATSTPAITLSTSITGILKGDGTAISAATAGTDYVTATSTTTLTNKRVTRRVTTITSHATPTINTDNCDAVTITAQAEALTSMTTNLTGAPANFDRLEFRIKDNGTARAITWGASFLAKGAALPTTTVVSKLLTVLFEYDTVTTAWGCIASSQEV